jgi:hypothetical protein
MAKQVRAFRNLEAWQRGMELVVEAYTLADKRRSPSSPHRSDERPCQFRRTWPRGTNGATRDTSITCELHLARSLNSRRKQRLR